MKPAPTPSLGRTIRERLRGAETALQEAGRAEARTLAEWLLAEAAGLGRLDVLAQGDRVLDESACHRLDSWVARVARGEPMQYVLGVAPFLGRNFHCDPRALIPRPETEELCEWALASISRDAATRIADVGTGSGCIAITIALERPHAQVTATDLSPLALDLARENAAQYGVQSRISWRQGDLLTGMPDDAFDMIVSNPPYVSENEWWQLDRTVRDYEPRLALIAERDGLDAIRRLAEQARHALAPGGTLWMEIGNDQGPAVRAFLIENGYEAVRIHRDLAGHERMAEARRPDV